jgi:hypothetical protein
MQKAYVHALISSQPEVLGLRLKPLTLGHLLILYSVDCGFLSGKESTIGEFAFAAWICSNRYSRIVEFIQSGTEKQANQLKKAFEKLGRKYADSIVSEIKAFQEYIDSEIIAPERMTTGKEKSPKSPWVVMVAIALMRYLKLSEKEVYEMPISKALSYYSVLGELNGDSSLLSDEQVSVIEKLENK